jgi:hypothetical protein
MTEVCGPGGWAVKGEKLWAVGHEAWWRLPLQDELVKAYRKAYERKAAYHAKQTAARPHVEERYSVPVVRDHWSAALKTLGEHFGMN